MARLGWVGSAWLGSLVLGTSGQGWSRLRLSGTDTKRRDLDVGLVWNGIGWAALGRFEFSYALLSLVEFGWAELSWVEPDSAGVSSARLV